MKQAVHAPAERNTRVKHWKGRKKKSTTSRQRTCGVYKKKLHNKKGSWSQTYKKNTESHAKVHDLNQKTVQALESSAFVYSAFEHRVTTKNKEDASYDKVLEEFPDAMGKFNEVQQVEEIAQEQFCNSRERHDKDFLESPETMFIVKGARNCARTGL